MHPPNSHGKLGGKSAGLFLARKIVERMQEEHEDLRGIRVPRTWHIASDGVIAFVRHNNLEDVYDRKYLEIDRGPPAVSPRDPGLQDQPSSPRRW